MDRQINEDSGEVTLTLKPQTSVQLSELYGISLKTFYRWVAPFKAEIGEKHGRYYTIAQVKIILQKLGMPSETITG